MGVLTPEYKESPKTWDEVAAGREWCARAAEAAVFQKKLATVAAGPAKRGKTKRVVLEQVSDAAQGFAVSMVLHRLENEQTPRRVWVLARDLKAQEILSQDLATWWGVAIFFPEAEELRTEDSLPDLEAQAERLALLQMLAEPAAKTEVLLLNVASLSEMVPPPGALAASRLTLRAGMEIELESVVKQLETAGYERQPQVGERGQFAVRGGILDVYAWQSELPLRAEFFDREVESLRTFDPDSQVSVGKLEEGSILLKVDGGGGGEEGGLVLLSECIGKGDVVIAVDPETDLPEATVWIGSGADPAAVAVEDARTACEDLPMGEFDAGDFVVHQARRSEFVAQLQRWHAEGWRAVMFFNNEGEIERFREMMESEALEQEILETRLGRVSRGFSVPSAKLAVLSDAEIFGRYQHSRARRLISGTRRQRSRKAPLDLSDIADGDFVVHQEYGIGKYRGLIQRAAPNGLEEDVVVLEYADDSKLYVPLPQAWMISRYVGVGKRTPDLNTLGDGRWTKTKKAAERSIFEYAENLLGMQAQRQTGKGYAHPPDTRWQGEFEGSFLYKETVDQLRAIEDTKRDMEDERAMDRLICGDVGFGKTEVAIRAAFKAVMGGKQVAMLAPTTVLSQQHYQNLRERFSDYPVRVEVLNRFRSAAESKKVLQALAAGDVDVLVGTHRLISKDVHFKNLGLAIVDEEQRFGVKHKEKFKELFHLVDVLTLSATPIPRTLYMALMGVRDMSTIDTAPPNRTPVETTICAYDERVVKRALERELKRKGQVYFLHNRVASIERTADKIRSLCPPGTRVDVGHGQMEEGMLEDVMARFVNAETDVLVSTTIIESGIDIPNANTIIIDRADLFGLADLYQLRGRVGRAGHKAYAFLMIPRSQMTTGDARKRINAMKQYTALGSGFKIAMRDLEIRGAGNLLGTQQSGHIIAVGFEMYCQMLKSAVNKHQGKRATGRVETVMAIDFVAFNEAAWLEAKDKKLPAFIPSSYITEPTQRIPAYRQIAEVTSLRELAELTRQWRDRYGRPPHSVENLLRCTELKIQAHNKGITTVEIKDHKLMLSKNGDFILIGGKFPRLREKAAPVHRLEEALNLLKQL
ncbi:MAG: mfd: transcription-repair coupling factor [Verrucomicrobiales bacterium]|nr:mfd: transcription-repair coupling factor [Verrucomicrobiales bacterium]